MVKPTVPDHAKPLHWLGNTKKELSGFPLEVRKRIGAALWQAQIGNKAPYAKPLKGFGDAGVLEIVDDFDGEPCPPLRSPGPAHRRAYGESLKAVSLRSLSEYSDPNSWR